MAARAARRGSGTGGSGSGGRRRGTFVCYLLRSCAPGGRSRRTYVGVTNDMVRRLRQHNGELAGGAKNTRVGRPWEVELWVEGFRTMREALQ